MTHVPVMEFLHGDVWPTFQGGLCSLCGVQIEEGDGVFISLPLKHRGLWCVECYLSPANDGSGITRCST